MQERSIWQRQSSASNLTDEPFRSENATDSITEERYSGILIQSTPIFGESSDERKLANWQAHLYVEIHNAIEGMSDLPEMEALHLDQNVAKRALAVVAFLKESLRVKPPKILNQDGGTVSLTWSDGGWKKFLNISEYEVDVLFMSTSSYEKREYVLSEGPEIPLSRFAEILNSRVKSSTCCDYE